MSPIILEGGGAAPGGGPASGPCFSWATESDLCSPCDDYAIDSALMDEYLLIATELLYQMSAQQFRGICNMDIRPCTRRSWETVWNRNSGHSTVLLYRGDVVCGCSDLDSCSCGSLSVLRLPHTPVVTILEVKVDGVVLDDGIDYRLDENALLVRLGGESWPCCQDLSLADTELDTFSVSFEYGREPPAIGRRAAAVLACELYAACNPDSFEGQCRLPRNVSQIARQGTTVLLSSFEQFVPRRGRPVYFGIPEIDMFLAAFNPYGRTSQSIVLSPDLPPTARKVGT